MTCCDVSEQSSWHESDLILPILEQASGLLKCKKDQLEIMDTPYMPHMSDPATADRALKRCGVKSGMPFTSHTRFHQHSQYNVGMILYRTREGAIQYVYASFRDHRGYVKDYLVVPHGSIFRLTRYFKRCYKRDHIKEAPILAEGFSEELLKQTIEFLIHSDEIEQYGVRVRRGVLLHGPPGNGKTMACQWLRKLCDEHNIKWTRVTAGEILDAFGKSQLDQLVSQAPVTFYDDIDMSFLCRRNSESSKVACALLAALDGVTSSSHVVRVFTTNEFASEIDNAFLRPGRIDKIFLFDKPTRSMREQLINQWPAEILENVGRDNIVEATGNFSFAETEAIRGLLVTKYIFDGNIWDLDAAVKDFGAYLGTKKPDSFSGFGHTNEQKTS